MEKIRWFIGALKNILFSIFVTFLALAIVGLISESIWIFLFSIIFAYVASDALLNLFIRGGGGWAKVFTSNHFIDKGYSYLVFLVGIIVGTILSSWGTGALMAYLQTIMPQYQATLLTDLIAVSVVAGDVQWRYFSR